MGKYSALPLFVTLYGLGVVMLLSLCATGGDAFVFVIPPREELCVWENAKPSYFVTVQFQVLEGGHQDVDIKFTFKEKNSANGVERLLMVAQRRSEEKYTFTVDQVGDYQFCFSNLMSLSSYKTINIVTMVTLPRAVVVEEFMDPLDEVVKQLGSSVEVVRDEQQAMKQREVVTTNLADATNAQVFWFSVVEFVVLFASVGYQVFNITRMFEVKRVL